MDGVGGSWTWQYMQRNTCMEAHKSRWLLGNGPDHHVLCWAFKWEGEIILSPYDEVWGWLHAKCMQIKVTSRERSRKSCVNISYQLGVDGLDYILSTQMRGWQVQIERQLYSKGTQTDVNSRKWSRKSSIKHETLVSSKDIGQKVKPEGVRSVSNNLCMTLTSS